MKELAPFLSCVCTEEELPEALASTYQEIYIKQDLGYMRHSKLSNGRFVRLKVDSLPKITPLPGTPIVETPKLEESLNFLPAGKIPFEYFEQIVEFFRQVSKKLKSDFEAHAWILWSKERGYFISIPEQSVGKASVSFTYDNESLPAGSSIIVDLHSHNTMNAFYSGTDNNNDKSGIYYSGVIGKLTDSSYEHVFRFNLYDLKKPCKLDEVFEITEKVVDVPKSWLDKVNNAPTKYIGYPGGTFGSSRHPATGMPTLFDQQYTYPGMDEVSLQEVQESLRGKGGKGNGRGNGKAGKKVKELTFEDAEFWNIVPGPMDVRASSEPPVVMETDDLGFGAKYGAEALESYNLIDDFLINLEECDDPLMDIINQCYNMLTEKAKMDIATNGLR